MNKKIDRGTIDLEKDIGLEKVQQRAAGFVTGNYERHSSVSAMLSARLYWESLERRRHNHRMVLFMKVARGEVMVPTEHILQINQSQTRVCRNQRLINKFAPTQRPTDNRFSLGL